MSSAATSLERAFQQQSEADQLSMFGADVSAAEIDALRDPKTGRLPPDAIRRLRAVPPDKRGPGRPLGAVNKRSEKLAQMVCQQFGDPVLGMASLYAQPIDQLCEMILIADGTIERRERLEELLVGLSEQVGNLARDRKLAMTSEDFRELTKACDALESAASAIQGKPGDLAIKALNLQLAARQAVAKYVHSQKPMAVDVTHRTDGVLVMPIGGGAAGDQAAFVHDKLQGLLREGRIDADQVARLEFRDGALFDPEGEIEDAEFDELEQSARDD